MRKLGEFTNFCRMSHTNFEFLLNNIESIIKKQTKIRLPIPPRIRLAITLPCLATEDSYKSLHYLFKVSTAAISSIVPEVCKAINIILKGEIKVSKRHTYVILICFKLFTSYVQPNALVKIFEDEVCSPCNTLKMYRCKIEQDVDYLKVHLVFHTARTYLLSFPHQNFI